jgi:hypothetical protein
MSRYARPYHPTGQPWVAEVRRPTATDPDVDHGPRVGGQIPAERLAYRVADLPNVVGLGRTLFYDAIRSGHLRARKYRSGTLVLRSDLIMFLENLPILGNDD